MIVLHIGSAIYGFVLLSLTFSFKLKVNNKMPHFIMGRPFHGFIPSALSNEERAANPVLKGTINQPIDHFNTSDTRVWIQRYFCNFKYYEEGGPMFLMLGGENEDDGEFISYDGIPIVSFARDLGAALFDLEHRFYGWSRPFDEQTTENLKYLSSQQALADAAFFVEEMNRFHNLTNPKWIVFGGSYSGNLAAWFREKYPHLVQGAIASSAPVEAVVDFYGYLKVVQKSISLYSKDCAIAIGDGFDKMIEMIVTEEGRDDLSDIFWTDPHFNQTRLRYDDITCFFQAITESFMGAVQYNQNNAEGYEFDGGIADVCKIMLKTSMPVVERIASVVEHMDIFYSTNYSGISINYDDTIEYLRITSYDDLEQAAARSWTWQTCTEFAYFQSTDQGRNIFGSTIPNNIYINTCIDVFGDEYNVIRISNNVKKTLENYGGSNNFTGTNVVFTNGNIDPWHFLGLYHSDEPSIVSYLIEGTAHVADIYEPSPDDPPQLKIARQLQYENIVKWINGATIEFVNTSIESIDNRTVIVYPNVTKLTIGTNSDDGDGIVDFSSNNVFLSEVKFVKLEDFEKLKKKSASKNKSNNLNRIINGRYIDGLLPEPDIPETMLAYPPGFKTGFIDQVLDHFDNKNPRMFKQRFWFNPQYYKIGGPLFLMIGGESEASPWWVLNPQVQIMRSARRYNAAVFQLEHRYYGLSHPTRNQSLANLRWLSSRQMLADIAQFIESMNHFQSYVQPKWIIFGGSYSGALAAWFRELYPHLAIGAIASSAPVEAKVDFYEYLIITQQSLRTYSKNCTDNIKEAFQELHNYSLTSNGRAFLSDLFQLQPQWTNQSIVSPVDFYNFFSNMYGIFQGAVQYNSVNKQISEITEVCRRMTNSSNTNLENLRDVNIYSAEVGGGHFNGTDNSYESSVELLRNVSFSSEYASARSWVYQTCTEFGYFQSTDIGRNIFGASAPVNFDINFCQDIFGLTITADSIFDAATKTNAFYGGRDHYTGTNVVLPNGSLDPWHALGYYITTDTVIPYLINGTAHCADMYPPREQDVPDLIEARNIIDANIEKWITNSETSTKAQVTTTVSDVPETTEITKKTSSTIHSPTTKPVATTTTSGCDCSTPAYAALLVLLGVNALYNFHYVKSVS